MDTEWLGMGSVVVFRACYVCRALPRAIRRQGYSTAVHCTSEPIQRQREPHPWPTTTDRLVTYVEFLALRQLFNAGQLEQIEEAFRRIVQGRARIFFRPLDPQ